MHILDRFDINEQKYNREVKRYIDALDKEYGKELTIDIDKYPDSACIDMDGRYIMDVHDSNELVIAIRAVYGTVVSLSKGLV